MKSVAIMRFLIIVGNEDRANSVEASHQRGKKVIFGKNLWVLELLATMDTCRNTGGKRIK